MSCCVITGTGTSFFRSSCAGCAEPAGDDVSDNETGAEDVEREAEDIEVGVSAEAGEAVASLAEDKVAEAAASVGVEDVAEGLAEDNEPKVEGEWGVANTAALADDNEGVVVGGR